MVVRYLGSGISGGCKWGVREGVVVREGCREDSLGASGGALGG